MIVTQSNLYAKEAMGEEKYSKYLKISTAEEGIVNVGPPEKVPQ